MVQSHKPGLFVRDKANSSAKHVVQKMIVFTWPLPHFGRYGNQLLLYYIAMHTVVDKNADRQIRILAPGFLLSRQAVRMEEVFELRSRPAYSAYFVGEEQVRNWRRSSVMKPADFLSKVVRQDKEEEVVWVVDEDALWDYGIGWWHLGMHTDAHWQAYHSMMFEQLHPSIQSVVDSVQTRYNTQSTVGVHLRAGDFRYHCSSWANIFLPNWWLWQCAYYGVSDAPNIAKTIQDARGGRRVMIAGDMTHSEAVQLKGVLEKNYRFDVLLASDLYDAPEHLKPVIDIELLRRSSRFIGSRMSTFSHMITARRAHYHSDHVPCRVLGVRVQRWTELGWLAFIAVLIVLKMRRMRPRPTLHARISAHLRAVFFRVMLLAAPFILQSPTFMPESLLAFLYGLLQKKYYTAFVVGLLVLAGVSTAGVWAYRRWVYSQHRQAARYDEETKIGLELMQHQSLLPSS